MHTGHTLLLPYTSQPTLDAAFRRAILERTRTHSDRMPHLLFAARASVNSWANGGTTALVIAIKAECASTVQLLLRMRANPRAEDFWGTTPLDMAHKLGLDKVAAALQDGRIIIASDFKRSRNHEWVEDDRAPKQRRVVPEQKEVE
eukprot:GEMP01016527.1.p1 GENE.GEMP01016527.1~~GEMP01016527.1.p1  ORF type:complete len:146 (+),score=34.38 GEMP01016527.1:207-644(+)